MLICYKKGIPFIQYCIELKLDKQSTPNHSDTKNLILTFGKLQLLSAPSNPTDCHWISPKSSLQNPIQSTLLLSSLQEWQLRSRPYYHWGTWLAVVQLTGGWDVKYNTVMFYQTLVPPFLLTLQSLKDNILTDTPLHPPYIAMATALSATGWSWVRCREVAGGWKK